MSTLTLKRDDNCRDCGKALRAGSKARWYPKRGTFCLVDCRPAPAPIPPPVPEVARRAYPCGHFAPMSAPNAPACVKCALALTEAQSVAFAVPASVTQRANDFAEGVQRAAAMLRAVLS